MLNKTPGFPSCFLHKTGGAQLSGPISRIPIPVLWCASYVRVVGSLSEKDGNFGSPLQYTTAASLPLKPPAAWARSDGALKIPGLLSNIMSEELTGTGTPTQA